MTCSDRFWSKVDQAGPDECWLWRSTRSSNGYGQFWINGRYRPAHQVAWELSRGRPFPPAMIACHTCDTPLCVNPVHLFEGTHLTNSLDSKAKGRNWHPIGELHPMAKLTSGQVEQIRAMAAAGQLQRVIASLFGVTPSNVSRIVGLGRWPV